MRKAYTVYEHLTRRISYREGSKYNQNLISGMVNEETVCTGYAKSLQYIYQKMGIPCRMVYGRPMDRIMRGIWYRSKVLTVM